MSEALRRHPTSQADAEGIDASLPRAFAWVLGFDHHAAWLGVAVGVTYLAVATAVVAAQGRASAVPSASFLAEHLSYALWFGLLPVAISILVRGLERDTSDLAPVLDPDRRDAASLFRETLKISPTPLWLGAGLGLAMTAGTIELFLNLNRHLGPSARQGLLFVSLRELVVEVALFLILGWAAGAAMRLSQLTEERARPDVIFTRPFAALARNGTRLAAVWLVFLAITVGLLADPETASALPALLLTLLVLASFAVVALILPCRGARRVIRAAKRAELELVREQTAEARRTREDVRLPGLLAWEARIENLSEWPIDAAALGRTGLFALLPVASWVASALVERLIDASLG